MTIDRPESDGQPPAPRTTARRAVQLAYVGALLLGLGFVQIRAQARQIEGGFRPFVAAPGRVDFSWDMFAPPIMRCDVTWSPPLVIEGRPMATLAERNLPLEFDYVDDDIDSYTRVAIEGCERGGAPGTHAAIACITPTGFTDAEITCP